MGEIDRGSSVVEDGDGAEGSVLDGCRDFQPGGMTRKGATGPNAVTPAHNRSIIQFLIAVPFSKPAKK